MQILFLPPLPTVVICFLIWPLLQVAAAYLCVKIPDRRYVPSSFFFRSHKWEKEGRIYDKIFKVSSWKGFLPDGGAITSGGYRKKHLTDFSGGNLQKFLIESCRAELSHWLAILPFWVFGFIAPARVIFYMLIYALVINLPCIIAQRYNRPRIIGLMERKNARQKAKRAESNAANV